MKCYCGHFIKESDNDNDFESITYVGRFGEDLLFSKHSDGSYVLSCFALNLWDIVVPEISKTRILNELSSTTDYCLYGSMLSSYQEFKKQREQAAQENQEIIDILLVVFYKMCKPIIDLTAPDTELEKGESTTVTLHCHYRDSDNYFPNLRDIDLPYYKLTISDGLSHLKVDKTELTTNENGVDTFRVTSKDGKGETIKVIFDVEGEYGQHAEGSITFYEEDEEPTFEFTVTMHEEDHVLCGTSPDNNDTTGESTASYYQGYVTITLDYSFTGTITKKVMALLKV